jgi:DNA-directed RNA polymerase specialized sigma24 family protein
VSIDGFQFPQATPDAEACLIEREHQEIASRVLQAMGERDRELLIRFYLREQSPRQIQEELSLSETQFRLIKSRAKARFTDLCREAIRPIRPKQIRPEVFYRPAVRLSA